MNKEEIGFLESCFQSGIVAEVHGMNNIPFAQDALNRIKNGDTLHLLPQADNQYDHKAVMVVTDNAELIGYIPYAHWLKADIFDAITNGVGEFFATAAFLRGWKDHHGVSVDITFVPYTIEDDEPVLIRKSSGRKPATRRDRREKTAAWKRAHPRAVKA